MKTTIFMANTGGACSQNPPITAELMPPMALDLGLHGRGTTPANKHLLCAPSDKDADAEKRK
jgi:hypothetical protein